MKKEYSIPSLEVLDITMTLAGPGIRTPDAYQPDPDAHHHDVVNFS